VSEQGGKTYRQAVKLALQLTSGTSIVFVCGSEAFGSRMRGLVEGLIRDAGCFPVDRYMKRFSVRVWE